MENKLSSANTGGWNSTILGEVAEFINGDRGKNYPNPLDRVENGVPFINTGHIEPTGWLSDERMDYITLEKFNKLGSGKVRNGDIVYCLRGSTIGKTARNKYSEGAIASSLIIIRAKKNISQDYLYYFLTSPFGQSLAKTNDNGSAQPNLSGRVLSQYPIKIPSYNQQCAIADYLNSLDNKIQLNQQTNQTLEQMAQTLFKSWFVDFDPVIDNALAAGNPIPDVLQERAELRQRVISERATNRKLKPLPDDIQQLFPSEFEESELGWIPKGWFSGALASLVRYSTSRMDGSKLTLENYISTENMLTNKQGVTKASSIPSLKSAPSFITGQVLISNIRPYFKKIWLATSNGGRSNDVLGFELLEPKTEAYLMNLLSQDQFFDFMMTTSKGSKMPRGDKKAIMDWGVVVPPVTIRKFYSNLVGDFYSANSIRTKENDSLVQLRDTLLPKLISGEVILESQIHHADGV
jgi:type I restriction enzyme S subunit